MERALNEDGIQVLKNWIKKGGKIIAMGESVGLFDDKKEFGISQNETETISEKSENSLEEKLLAYDQREINEFTKHNNWKRLQSNDRHPLTRWLLAILKTYYSLKQGSESYQLIDRRV